MKKLVYEVYVLDDKKICISSAFKVYSDGTILKILPTNCNRNAIADWVHDWLQSETDDMNKRIQQKKENPEELSYIGDWPASYNINMPLISPKEDEDAFSTLCLLLHDKLPFSSRIA